MVGANESDFNSSFLVREQGVAGLFAVFGMFILEKGTSFLFPATHEGVSALGTVPGRNQVAACKSGGHNFPAAVAYPINPTPSRWATVGPKEISFSFGYPFIKKSTQETVYE
jgi:hypothetical protein